MRFVFVKNKLASFSHGSVLLFKMNFLITLTNSVETLDQEEKRFMTKKDNVKMEVFVSHKFKFLKSSRIKNAKISPDSKRYNSQQEVKRCFEIR